jgi:hypothetical protein
MFNALHANHDGHLYRVYAAGRGEIADLVRQHLLESATSDDGSLAFWFTPSRHPSHTRANRIATELLLLATGGLTARQVPLLRGDIVITGNDAHGDPADLTSQQMTHLVNSAPTHRQDWTLSRRFARDERRRRRSLRMDNAARTDRILRPW